MADKNTKKATKKTTEELVEAMEHFITTKSVVGEPIKIGDTILLPLADVSFGMGIGMFSKGENGTGGVGGKITPNAVLVLKKGSSKIISVKDADGMSKILDIVPDVVDKFGDKFTKKDKKEEETVEED
ncbi:MAG: GerW family sporulation protein [Eubacterium sp.]|nr:GerW family sporulation protein [Eubacterium sp.]